VDRRVLLIAGQIVSVLPAAALAVWTAAVGVEGLPGAWPVLAAAGIIGIGWAISVPTMQALVPALVEPDDLEQAIALNAITFNVARAIGPAVGATALAALGAAATFGLNAASYVILIVALLLVRPRAVVRDRERGDGSVREGLRYVRSEPALVVLLIGVAALGFGTDPVITLAPAMARVLGGGTPAVGWMASAFGIGAALMAFGIGTVRKWVSLPRLAVGGLILLSVGLVGWAASPNVVTGVGLLVFAGAGFLMALTGLTTELQRRVPEQFLGRVMALWSVAFLGSRPAAALLDGVLGDTFGPRVGLATAAAITGGAALWVHRARHHLHIDDAPLPSAPAGAAEAPPVG
jgi:predicted MFS family arabinose efflux permease